MDFFFRKKIVDIWIFGTFAILTITKVPLDQFHQTLDLLHLISEDALSLVWKRLWRCISITFFHWSLCAGMRQLSQAQKSKPVHLKENRSALQFLIWLSHKNPTSFRDAPECSACSKAAPLGLNETEAAALTALHHPQASPVSPAPSLLSASHRKCGNGSRKKGQSCLFFSYPHLCLSFINCFHPFWWMSYV